MTRGNDQGKEKERAVKQENKRERLFEALSATEGSSFADVVSAVKDYAIFALDRGGNVKTWNEGARRMKGYTREEILGQHFSMFYTAEDQKGNHPAFELEQALKNGSYEEEGLRVRKDGTIFWAAVTLTPILSGEGGFIKVTRDLTERKEAEQRISDFYAILTHELRTPLTSMLGSLRLILGGVADPDSDQGRQLLSINQTETERMLRLIDNLLDMKKIEEGQWPMQKGWHSPDILVSGALRAVKGMAETAHVTLISDIKCDDAIECDKDLIVQVLVNLLSNAVKFTPQSEVTVKVERETAAMRFSVTDKGKGIEPLQLRKLFQKFQQLSNQPDGYKGSGLGLSISKCIVEQHEGKISVESKIARGTTFWFTLPVAPVDS